MLKLCLMPKMYIGDSKIIVPKKMSRLKPPISEYSAPSFFTVFQPEYILHTIINTVSGIMLKLRRVESPMCQYEKTIMKHEMA